MLTFLYNELSCAGGVFKAICGLCDICARVWLVAMNDFHCVGVVSALDEFHAICQWILQRLVILQPNDIDGLFFQLKLECGSFASWNFFNIEKHFNKTKNSNVGNFFWQTRKIFFWKQKKSLSLIFFMWCLDVRMCVCVLKKIFIIRRCWLQ